MANVSAALLHLCKDAHEATSHLVLHVQDRQRMSAAQTRLNICRNDHPPMPGSWIIASTEKLLGERAICAEINTSPTAPFSAHAQLAQQYAEGLAVARLTDKIVCPLFTVPSWKKWIMPFGYPVYLLGLLLNGGPVWLARKIADKKVYRADFYSWIFVVGYCFAYLGWLLLLTTAGCLLLGLVPGLLLLFTTVVSGIFAYYYHGDRALLGMQQRLKSANPEALAQLRLWRSQLQAGSL